VYRPRPRPRPRRPGSGAVCRLPHHPGPPRARWAGRPCGRQRADTSRGQQAHVCQPSNIQYRGQGQEDVRFVSLLTRRYQRTQDDVGERLPRPSRCP
jgi:hypothetical protein